MRVEVFDDRNMIEQAFNAKYVREYLTVRTVRGIETDIMSCDLSDEEQSDFNFGEGQAAIGYMADGTRFMVRGRNEHDGSLTITFNAPSIDAVRILSDAMDPYFEEHDKYDHLNYVQL